MGNLVSEMGFMCFWGGEQEGVCRETGVPVVCWKDTSWEGSEMTSRKAICIILLSLYIFREGDNEHGGNDPS